MTRPALTPQRQERRSSLATESLWGASEIARFMGTSDDFIRKIATSPTCPIRKIEGRYYCTRTEIVVWLQAPEKKIA